MSEFKGLVNNINPSIEKKIEIFRQLLLIVEKQSKLLKTNDIEIEEFENLMDGKSILLENLEVIDDYLAIELPKIQQYLEHQTDNNADTSHKLRDGFEKITDIGQEISKLEQENQIKIQSYFDLKKTSIQSFRTTNKASSKYNQNMPSTHKGDMTYFLDSKK